MPRYIHAECPHNAVKTSIPRSLIALVPPRADPRDDHRRRTIVLDVHVVVARLSRLEVVDTAISVAMNDEQLEWTTIKTSRPHMQIIDETSASDEC